MAISRGFVMSLVAAATLCGGVLEGMAAAGLEAGCARVQPCDLGAAGLDSALDAEVDTVDECPHDPDWPADGQVHAAENCPGFGRFVIVRSAPVALRQGRASSSIRGPPARG